MLTEAAQAERPRRARHGELWRRSDVVKAGPDGKTAGERLIALRIAKGFPTATLAAKAIGVAKVTYQHHENSRRDMGRRAVEIYAKFYGTTPGYIMYGDAPLEAPPTLLPVKVPVVGKLIRCAAIGKHNNQKWIEAPPFRDVRNLRAVLVRSDCNSPVYEAGDVIYYHELERPGTQHNGRECVVQVPGESRLMIRMVTRLSLHLWSLEGHGCEPTPRTHLVGAGVVAWVQRNALPPIAS